MFASNSTKSNLIKSVIAHGTSARKKTKTNADDGKKKRIVLGFELVKMSDVVRRKSLVLLPPAATRKIRPKLSVRRRDGCRLREKLMLGNGRHARLTG
jgi:hypothetical protein